MKKKTNTKITKELIFLSDKNNNQKKKKIEDFNIFRKNGSAYPNNLIKS